MESAKLSAKNTKSTSDFYDCAYNEMFDRSKKTMVLLQQLTYSHEMM
jgi:hypothetical protein